jgi:hypothetical protein
MLAGTRLGSIAMQLLVELLKKIGTANRSITSHAPAWVTRLQDGDSSLSGQALEGICEKQLEDRRWETALSFCYHDRIICTLSAMTCLSDKGCRQQDEIRIQRGLRHGKAKLQFMDSQKDN